MWYVIWALARKEKELINIITDKVPANVYTRVWTPCKKEIRRYSGHQTTVDIILFPGYVFIDTDDPDAVHQYLYRYSSYIRFLKDGESYSPVSDHERSIIEHFTGESGTAGISMGVISDGRLHILDGPLVGMESQITKIDRHRRKAYVQIDNLLGEDRVLSFGLEVIDKTE